MDSNIVLLIVGFLVVLLLILIVPRLLVILAEDVFHIRGARRGDVEGMEYRGMGRMGASESSDPEAAAEQDYSDPSNDAAP